MVDFKFCLNFQHRRFEISLLTDNVRSNPFQIFFVEMSCTNHINFNSPLALIMKNFMIEERGFLAQYEVMVHTSFFQHVSVFKFFLNFYAKTIQQICLKFLTVVPL